MFAENMEKMSAEKENIQCCLVKFKFAVCKIFKQILSKDNKHTENHNNTTSVYNFPVNNKCSFANEIEQNQANERLLKASQQKQKHQQQQPYVLAIETTVGSFYWDWECGMQRDSFADFNFHTH